MSDTPKFEVIDRRKFKAEEEQASQQSEQAAERKPEPALPHAGPQLVVNEHSAAADAAAAHKEDAGAREFDAEAEASGAGTEGAQGLPPAPTAQESREQAAAYDAAALRLEELIRAQNPAVGAQPPMTFEMLVQQFYVSAMIQMGAGAQEGQRPRVDILGARTTIDMLGVLAEKTRGNLSPAEDQALQTVLYEVRMAFLELTSMISLQAMQPPQPPPPGKR
jgi:hypothetical protein